MRRVSWCSTVALFLLAPLQAGAQETNVAASLIPFASLTLTNRALVRSVTDHYTLRRQYDVRELRAGKKYLDYLMDHLDVCSVLAQSLGLIQYRATREADGRLFADNREGAQGHLTLAYAGNGKRVYYVEGTETGLFSVEGRAVAVVDYSQTNADTLCYTGAMFVKVDNVVIAALAQLFGMFLQGTVDHHFHHVMGHPIRLSELAVVDPQLLLDKIGQMPDADRLLLAPFAELLHSGRAR